MPDEVINDIPAVDTRKNLLEQDDAQTLVTLVNAAGTVTGTGGQLQLVDENGQAISHSQTFDVTQGGEVVAQGNYDYKLLGSSDGIKGDGLYIGYGLKSLDLQGTGDKALVLTPRANAQGLQTDLGAQLTGAGIWPSKLRGRLSHCLTAVITTPGIRWCAAAHYRWQMIMYLAQQVI